MAHYCPADAVCIPLIINSVYEVNKCDGKVSIVLYEGRCGQSSGLPAIKLCVNVVWISCKFDMNLTLLSFLKLDKSIDEITALALLSLTGTIVENVFQHYFSIRFHLFISTKNYIWTISNYALSMF